MFPFSEGERSWAQKDWINLIAITHKTDRLQEGLVKIDFQYHQKQAQHGRRVSE